MLILFCFSILFICLIVTGNSMFYNQDFEQMLSQIFVLGIKMSDMTPSKALIIVVFYVY